MKRLLVVLMLFLPSHARCETLSGPGPALAAIREFAEDFCGSEPTKLEQMKGTDRKIELSASAKAGLSKLFKDFAEVGLDLTGKISQSQYQGVLQADIPRILADKRNCRITIFNTLVASLIDQETRELKFTIRRAFEFLNVAEGPRKFGNVAVKQLFKQDPNAESTANGLSLRIREIKLSGTPPVSTIEFVLTAPQDSRLKFEADELSTTQISTATCKAISITVGKLVYTPSDEMKSKVDLGDLPLRQSDKTKPACVNSLQKCKVNVELSARCTIDA